MMNRRCQSGFTLIELMTVIGIMMLIAAIAIPSVSGLRKSKNITAAGYAVSGLLEQARIYAMANNTYVWVGFLEEGGGRLTLAAVASKNGERYTGADGQRDLVMISKLLKIDSVRLVAANTGDLASNQPRRPAVPDEYQVGGDDFATALTISVPPGGAPQCTFAKLIEFNSRGEACKIGENIFSGPGLPDYIEIALVPAPGGKIEPRYADGDKAAVAIQVAGLSGQIRVYQP